MPSGFFPLHLNGYLDNNNNNNNNNNKEKKRHFGKT
jgi:hypothetical protein